MERYIALCFGWFRVIEGIRHDATKAYIDHVEKITQHYQKTKFSEPFQRGGRTIFGAGSDRPEE